MCIIALFIKNSSLENSHIFFSLLVESRSPNVERDWVYVSVISLTQKKMPPKQKKPQNENNEEGEEPFQAVILTDSFEDQFLPISHEMPRVRDSIV